MIYQQPVCYEFSRLAVPTLLIIGSEDRTIVGKALLADSAKKSHGQYPELGAKTIAAIPQGTLRVLPGIGHIPHIQQPELFLAELGKFLDAR